MEKILKYQKQLFFLCIALIIGAFVFTLYQGKSHIFRKFDYKTWENKYDKSQWVIPQSKTEISDEDLYIYVGSKLVQGYNPTLANVETPPLGKYLIGFSETIFGNIGIYGIIFSALSLILFFVFNKKLFKTNLLSAVPVLFLAIDPIFREQIGVSLLDAQYLCMLLLTFILVLNRKYLLAASAIGLFMATKSPFITGVLYVSIFGFFILKKDFDFKKYMLMPVITLLVYSLIYIKFFLLGHSYLDFLRVQKFVVHFYQTGVSAPKGAVFPLLLSGYWFTWFNKNGFVKDWSILWPISFGLSLLAGFKLWREKKIPDELLLPGIWLIFYFIFLIFVPVFSRYLLLALPFMYNFGIWVLLKTVKPLRLLSS